MSNYVYSKFVWSPVLSLVLFILIYSSYFSCRTVAFVVLGKFSDYLRRKLAKDHKSYGSAATLISKFDVSKFQVSRSSISVPNICCSVSYSESDRWYTISPQILNFIILFTIFISKEVLVAINVNILDDRRQPTVLSLVITIPDIWT